MNVHDEDGYKVVVNILEKHYEVVLMYSLLLFEQVFGLQLMNGNEKYCYLSHLRNRCLLMHLRELLGI
jgi:hypothetical protein